MLFFMVSKKANARTLAFFIFKIVLNTPKQVESLEKWYCMYMLSRSVAFCYDNQQKIKMYCPHTFLVKWSKGVEHPHSLMFRSVFQSSATDSKSLPISSTADSSLTSTALSGWSLSVTRNRFSYKSLLSVTTFTAFLLSRNFTEVMLWNKITRWRHFKRLKYLSQVLYVVFKRGAVITSGE